MSERPDITAIITRANRRREKARGDPSTSDILALVLWVDYLEKQDREQAIARLSGCPRCPERWQAPAPYRRST